MAFGPADLFSMASGGDDDVFGTRPKVAPFVPIDLSDETQKALAANLENLPEALDFLNKAIPGFSDLLTKGISTTSLDLDVAGQLLRGELPQDVIDQITRQGAFKSLAGGFAGTPMARSLTLRDIGRTSLDAIGQGAGLLGAGTNSAQLWSNIAEQALSPFTISTTQQAGTTAANNAGQQAFLQAKYNVAASPDPAAAAKYNTNLALFQQALSIAGGIAGGMLGSSGGGGQQYPAGTSSTSTNSWQLLGGSGNQPAYQYNPQTGQYGSVPAAQPVWSDRELKEALRFVGKSPLGLNIYRFRYRGVEGEFEGVLADEVERIVPEAVMQLGQFKAVDYAKLDVDFKRVA